MKERPIIFSGPMVRAILEGRKTQTRRVAKVRGLEFIGGSGDENDPAAWGVEWPDREGYATLADGIPCPYGQPGDRLWVRETWELTSVTTSDVADWDGYTGPIPKEAAPWCYVVYRADGCNMGFERWRPSIHMPRWASRILLEVTDVRVDRVQDISEADARAEGVSPVWYTSVRHRACIPTQSARDGFERLWDSINAGRGHGWDTNPWVWVIQFRVINAQEA